MTAVVTTQSCYPLMSAVMAYTFSDLPERLRMYIVLDPDGCWRWVGALDKGYGRTWARPDGLKRMASAHRLVYELLIGPIPDGMSLDHMCHNDDPRCVGGNSCPHRACCNPDHLRVATRRENVLASPNTFVGINARKTHCIHGHEFTEANTYVYKNRRNCRVCRRRLSQASYRRKHSWP